MNDIFNPVRFFNFLKRDIMLFRKTYLYLLSLLVGSYAIALAIYYILGLSFSGLIYFVIMVCVLFGPCILEKNFSRYSGIQDFTFPVSVLERFLSFLLRYVVILPVGFIGIFYLLNLLVGLIPVDVFQSFSAKVNYSLLSVDNIWLVLGFQSVYMVGYLTFKRYSFVKTTLIIWGAIIAFVLFAGFVLTSLATFQTGEIDFQRHIFSTMMERSEDIAHIIVKVLYYFLLFVFPFGLWIVSYFKLKEMEI